MSSGGQKPREWRRRVLIRARIRLGMRWKDVWILNLSSRGMLIRTLDPLAPGSRVELLRGDQLIHAMVVWRHGTCAGLQSDERLFVERMLSESGSAVAVPARGTEPEQSHIRVPCRQVDSRARGRLLQFAGTAALAIALVLSVSFIAERAFARPLALVRAALSPTGHYSAPADSR